MQVTHTADGGLLLADHETNLHLSYDQIRGLFDHLPAHEWASIAIRPRIPLASRNGIRAVPPALKIALQNAWELVVETHDNLETNWQVVIRRFPK